MMNVEDYLAQLPSQHRDCRRYRAFIALMLEPLMQARDLALAMPSHFDIDTAIGAQLDVLGLWIGRSRFIQQPLPEGSFFTWDTVPAEGWDSSVWIGEHTATDETVKLLDDDYRKLLKAKISANNWKGDRAGQYRTLREAYGASKAAGILIRDNQDMTQTVIYNSGVLTLTEETLLVREYVLIRPCGVGVNFEKYFLPPFTMSIFRGGVLLDGEIIQASLFGETVTLDADDWIIARAWLPFTAETVFVVKAGGVPFATITFPAGGVAPVQATVVMVEDERVVGPAELITFEGPAIHDETGGNLSIGIRGYRAPTF